MESFQNFDRSLAVGKETVNWTPIFDEICSVRISEFIAAHNKLVAVIS